MENIRSVSLALAKSTDVKLFISIHGFAEKMLTLGIRERRIYPNKPLKVY